MTEHAENIHCPGCNASWSYFPPVRIIESHTQFDRQPVYGAEVRCVECKRVYTLPIMHGFHR